MIRAQQICTHAFVWWWAGLVAWLPDRWQQPSGPRRRILCHVEDQHLHVRLVERGGNVLDQQVLSLVEGNPLAQKWSRRYGGIEHVLSLSRETTLIRPLTLPATATANLSSILRFEIDRQTPFAPEQVYYGYATEQGNVAGESIRLHLAVAPRKAIDGLLKRIASQGIKPSRLLINNPDGTDIEIPLAGTGEPDTTNPGRLNAWLLLLAGTLILTGLYQPMLQYENAIETLKPHMETAKKKARVATELHKRNETNSAHTRFLHEKFSGRRSHLEVMNTLARLLPDETWLEHIKIHDNRLNIRGESDSAAALVILLTNSESFEDARFTSPVVRNDKSGKERFSLEAGIVSSMGQDNV